MTPSLIREIDLCHDATRDGGGRRGDEEANNALLLSKVHENSLLSSQYVDRVDAHFNLNITYNPVVQEYENFEEKTVNMYYVSEPAQLTHAGF